VVLAGKFGLGAPSPIICHNFSPVVINNCKKIISLISVLLLGCKCYPDETVQRTFLMKTRGALTSWRPLNFDHHHHIIAMPLINNYHYSCDEN